MRLPGTTVLKIENGWIVSEIGLDDGVKALVLDSLRRAEPAQTVWMAARDLYAGADAEAGVAECDARLDDEAAS